jgi:hypothetical protein
LPRLYCRGFIAALHIVSCSNQVERNHLRFQDVSNVAV